MARPREFNEGQVLDAAMNRFWERGYKATSVRDLATEMGITGPSLYNAFGDKRSLFRKVLERYAHYSARARIARLESSLPPKQAVQTFITEIVEHSLDDRQRRGCMLVNSALVSAPQDSQIGLDVSERLGEIEAFFRRAITAAQADGALPLDRDPKDLARLLLGVVLGIRVLARANPDRKLLEGLARPALSLLDWPSQSKKSKKI
jgi:TetR/AcrR family transcriptional repressor of nem operon